MIWSNVTTWSANNEPLVDASFLVALSIFLRKKILFWIMHPTTYLVGCVIQKRFRDFSKYTYTSEWVLTPTRSWDIIGTLEPTFSSIFSQHKPGDPSSSCVQILFSLSVSGMWSAHSTIGRHSCPEMAHFVLISGDSDFGKNLTALGHLSVQISKDP